MELLHNLQHCSQALMYTIHTCYTPALAVSGTSWASWCVHFPPLSVCCWRFSASLSYGQTSVGEGEEWVRGGRSILALVRQNIVQTLCTYAEAAKQQIICTKHWKILILMAVQYAACKAYALGYAPWENIGILVLWECICWLSTFQHKLTESALRWVLQLTNCHQNCTKSNSSWPTTCAISCRG